MRNFPKESGSNRRSEWPELAAAQDFDQFRVAGMILEQMAHHQHELALAAATEFRCSASPMSSASGFSTNTCLPCSIAVSASV